MTLKMFKKHKIKVGAEAPDFSLPDQHGQSVRLSDFQGESVVVLYFYPKDDTYGCIAESSNFRDNYEVFKQANAEVIGVSSDDIQSHQAFAKKYNLPFVLLSDPDSHVRELYQVPATFGIIPGRVTFVIDKQGVIRHIFNSQFQPVSHVEQALEIVKQLQKG